MYTKTLVKDVNWLDKIDGLTIADAIKYLQTLDQSHILSCYMDGDTHGCEIVSRLEYFVPMTNAEILATIDKNYLKQIGIYEKARENHIKAGRQDRADSCKESINSLIGKWNDAKLKYQ
jgi:hypothetical protein